MFKYILFALLATVALASASSPPTPTFPYSTTMLRTHRFAPSTPPTVFLSIYEEMSVYQDDQTGHVWSAVNIDTGWPFSIRDADDTYIAGMRVVYEYDSATDPTYFNEWYYMTDPNGTEYCVQQVKVEYNPLITTSVGSKTIRGAETEGWMVQDTVTGINTTTYYTPDVEGTFSFRTVNEYPRTENAAEWGYVLDEGTHFVGVLQKQWFDTSGCDPSAVRAHPWQGKEWAKEHVWAGNVQPMDLFSRFHNTN
jgi:hypothetical protein